ncbi:MAG: YjjG family noncanonical pyrimidine nucleotidase [Bacteroidales bacterium]|nr:YjjG family noncanonical pyrimidine nucleotidase [Bacteroidales bacterium]MCF8327361.1 YjjG family noncanonical pyrimidine nucleotidase [Bacteroidales bacterium]
MKEYKYLFIDLDGTMWDFAQNARTTLYEIFDFHNFKNSGVESFNTFLSIYQKINTDLWALFREEKVSKDFLSVERFRKTLAQLSQDENKANQMAQQYLSWSSEKTQLYPGVIDTLEHLQKKYTLHILTNGFNEVQYKKIENSGLSPYFHTIITSDDAGAKKPEKQFFDYAFLHTQAKPEQTLMIGDNEEVDIAGAIKADIDQVFVNMDKRQVPGLNPTFEIQNFSELKTML